MSIADTKTTGRWADRARAMVTVCLYLGTIVAGLVCLSDPEAVVFGNAPLRLSWAAGFALALGLWRFRLVATLSQRLRAYLLFAVLLLSLLSGFWLGPGLILFMLVGLGILLTWGVTWSEATSAVMLDGPLKRLVWALVGSAFPGALIGGYVLMIGLWRRWRMTSEFGWFLPAMLVCCQLVVILVAIRSYRARHRARRYLAIQDGTIHELEPE